MADALAIVSGYFNPLHVGHLRMMRAARELAGGLIVVVNNDEQQVLKKGRVIQLLADRVEIVRELRVVDEVVESIDADASVRETLAQVRASHPDATLIFANGGDRSEPESISEYETCQTLGIELAFGVGGTDKADSSTRINAAVDEG